MQKITNHYHQLLGLPDTWSVEGVELSLDTPKVEIRIHYTGSGIKCPQCGSLGTVHDRSPEQRWRHLDTMQFETMIVARVPRCRCKDCGVKTIEVPWAVRHSRFTLMFEEVAILVLQHSASIHAASKILRLDWHAVNGIMERAVTRGLSRRAPDIITRIGIDEKSFRSGHRYITTLNDLVGSRVIDVVEDRTTEATESLLNALTQAQLDGVISVSVDMWKAFAIAINRLLKNAAIVHDRFHISKYLNDAVDAVRRQESKTLAKEGDNTLVGSKFNWLRNPENMTEKQKNNFDALMECELKTGVAWSQKNIYREFWSCSTRFSASLFFAHWSEMVDRSELKPMIKVKELLERHLDNVLNYFDHRITNAVSEGLNSKIQTIKAAARGFHNFMSYRTRILFFCGKLDMSIY